MAEAAVIGEITIMLYTQQDKILGGRFDAAQQQPPFLRYRSCCHVVK